MDKRLVVMAMHTVLNLDAFFSLRFLFCRKKGFDVKSFGTGSHVRIPGPSADEPNVFNFDVTYDAMYKKLLAADKDLYPRHLLSERLLSLFVVWVL